MEILKKVINNGYFSILLEDKNEDIKFWIDCSLIDNCGHNDENGDFINWEFNQYIFSNYNDEDARQKAYQEDGEKVEQLIYFIDEHEQDLINWYKSARGGNNEE